MLAPSAALAVLALTARVPSVPPQDLAEHSRGSLPLGADLTLRRAASVVGAPGLFARADDRGGAMPACPADVCPPAVAVPGYDLRATRGSRTDLVLLALQRARIEPVASIAWALTSTGLRLDWTPSSFDTNANARGWGSAILRLRIRIDATNRFVFPKRPRPS